MFENFYLRIIFKNVISVDYKNSIFYKSSNTHIKMICIFIKRKFSLKTYQRLETVIKK